MQIVKMPVDGLIEYENNPRFNDDAVEPVARSIESFGFKVPIVVDSNNVIIAGHTRLKAAKFLGLDEVPVIVADDLTEDQVKAFRLADNKVGELATWDIEALSVELDEIEIDMGEFGFVEVEDYDFAVESFGDQEEKETTEFSMTFVFPIESKQEVEDYVKGVGKDFIVDMIISKAGGIDA